MAWRTFDDESQWTRTDILVMNVIAGRPSYDVRSIGIP